jgi:hypothetical protein
MNTTATAESKTTLADRLMGWSAEPPTEQDWYWHWNGDPECAPLPTSVLYSGSTGTCFVSRGQLGLQEAIYCSEYGGYWQRMTAPDVPEDPL